jgi:tetratricopeptide (TPR) repeat protein
MKKKSIIFILILSASCNERSESVRRHSQGSTEPISSAQIDSAITVANKFYDTDNYLQAVKSFSYLLSKDSTNGEYYYKRAYSYTKLLNRQEAIQDFQQAIRLHFKSASACFNIGINSSFDNDSLALYYFEKCVELDPSYPQAYVEIHECRERLKKEHSGLN